MDAFLPGVEGWEPIYNKPAIWRFRFNGPTPRRSSPGVSACTSSISGTTSRPTDAFDSGNRATSYTAAYARPGRMRAGWAYFVSFQQAATDFSPVSRARKLPMPVLSDRWREGPTAQRWLRRSNWSPRMRRRDSAEYRPLGDGGESERRNQCAHAIPEGLILCTASNADDARGGRGESDRLGSDRQFRVGRREYERCCFGNPSSSGFYTVVLFVPAHTTIPAQCPSATIAWPRSSSGTWQFGYGDRFDEGALKILPAGSVYSEPVR